MTKLVQDDLSLRSTQERALLLMLEKAESECRMARKGLERGSLVITRYHVENAVQSLFDGKVNLAALEA